MYEHIVSLDNLYKAADNAMKGKKSTKAAAKFWFHQEEELEKMHKDLNIHSYKWGGYRTFELNENSVKRRISVAPFRDRVLHHAMMQTKI